MAYVIGISCIEYRIHRIMARPAEFDRELVLDQAKNLFWRQGYRMTTINDLVQATGMQPGSLYAAFKSKKKLFLLVVDHYAQEVRDSMRVIFAEKQSALAGVRGFVESVYARASNSSDWQGCLLVNSMVEFSHNGESEIQNRLRSIFSDLESIFARQLNRARVSGELGSEADPQALAAYLITCLWGVNAIRGSQPDSRKLAGIVKMILAPLR
jgi:TetR/AcrR family transcriptional repressor of nem operon